MNMPNYTAMRRLRTAPGSQQPIPRRQEEELEQRTTGAYTPRPLDTKAEIGGASEFRNVEAFEAYMRTKTEGPNTNYQS